MWFNRKKKNRRKQRRHVLDVKLRSDQVRAVRTRGLVVMVGVLLGTVFTVYVVWRSGEWLLDRLVYENPAFAIRQVEIQTDGVIAVEQLERWSGVKPGENLLALDLARVKRDLELVPNIRSVSVERLLPRTVRLRVMERKPLARVTWLGMDADGQWTAQTWLLDAEGMVMMPLANRQQQPDGADPARTLPLLTGVPAEDLRLGCRVTSPRILAALQLLESYEQSEMSTLMALRSVDVSDPLVLVARTDAGAQVTLARGNYEMQLRRWREIHARSVQLNKTILTLDLAVSNNVPVRWVEARLREAARSSAPPVPSTGNSHV